MVGSPFSLLWSDALCHYDRSMPPISSLAPFMTLLVLASDPPYVMAPILSLSSGRSEMKKLYAGMGSQVNEMVDSKIVDKSRDDGPPSQSLNQLVMRRISREKELNWLLISYEGQDGDHIMTSSNTSNIKELDGSFAVPTQPINSLCHDIPDKKLMAHLPLLHKQSSQHDIRMLCMDANIRQHQPALQPVSNVCRMSNAQFNNLSPLKVGGDYPTGNIESSVVDIDPMDMFESMQEALHRSNLEVR
ncbi:hypothetical protein Tco_0605654 [Tanacetum coccineum]